MNKTVASHLLAVLIGAWLTLVFGLLTFNAHQRRHHPKAVEDQAKWPVEIVRVPPHLHECRAPTCVHVWQSAPDSLYCYDPEPTGWFRCATFQTSSADVPLGGLVEYVIHPIGEWCPFTTRGRVEATGIGHWHYPDTGNPVHLPTCVEAVK